MIELGMNGLLEHCSQRVRVQFVDEPATILPDGEVQKVVARQGEWN
jgi:hypothetical protein